VLTGVSNRKWHAGSNTLGYIDFNIGVGYNRSMLDTSIITGKAWTGNPSASNSVAKRLYLKIFPGEFWYRAPRAKKAKMYGGELFVRYSGREWPEKKNGPLAGDPGLLAGISGLLKELNLQYSDEISWAKVQHELKETLTLTVGPNLAKEIVDRGWAQLIEIKDPVLPKESKVLQPLASNDQVNDPPKSEIVNIGEIVEIPADDNGSLQNANLPLVETSTESINRLYGKNKRPAKKSKPTDK